MKKTHLINIFVIIILPLVFATCEKTDITTKKTSNPLIEEMMSKINQQSISINPAGVMVFKDRETLKNVLDILYYYCDEITDRDTSISYRELLDLFNSSLNFSSLYDQIENEIESRENKDDLSEDNDPDNHFIGNIFFRSVLNPNCEIIVDQVWYIICENFTIGIMNYDRETRDEILHLLTLKSPDEDFFFYCNRHKNAFIMSPNEANVSLDFRFQVSKSNPLCYSFCNTSSCEEYEKVTYLWDFGDGCTSNDPNPSHTYASTGSKTITLTSIFNGNRKEIKKIINVGIVSSNFTSSQDFDGKHYFSANIDDSTIKVSHYIWLFGDGTSITTNDSNCTHTYTDGNNTHNVELIVETVSGQHVSCKKSIVEFFNSNCRSVAYKRSGSNPYEHGYLGDNKYAKTSIDAYSGYILKYMIIRKKVIFFLDFPLIFSIFAAQKLMYETT